MFSLVRNMSANTLTVFAGDVLLSSFITEGQKEILTWLKIFLSPNEDPLSSLQCSLLLLRALQRITTSCWMNPSRFCSLPLTWPDLHSLSNLQDKLCLLLLPLQVPLMIAKKKKIPICSLTSQPNTTPFFISIRKGKPHLISLSKVIPFLSHTTLVLATPREPFCALKAVCAFSTWFISNVLFLDLFILGVWRRKGAVKSQIPVPGLPWSFDVDH